MVRVHPRFKVILDRQGRLISSTADLAVILLNKPVAPRFGAAALADAPVQVNESIIMVGYGYDEVADVHGADRRFSSNKVLRFLHPLEEVVLVEQPGQHRYKSDSGGPCFREDSKGTWLIGVSTRNLGAGATFTSTSLHLDWLRDEIQRASSPPPP